MAIIPGKKIDLRVANKPRQEGLHIGWIISKHGSPDQTLMPAYESTLTVVKPDHDVKQPYPF